MQERVFGQHGRVLAVDPVEQVRDRGRVGHYGAGRVDAARRHAAAGRLDEPTAVGGGRGTDRLVHCARALQVSAAERQRGGHDGGTPAGGATLDGGEQVVGELGHGVRARVRLAAERARHETGHVKVQPAVRHQVGGALFHVGVGLAVGEPQPGRHAGHRVRDQVVEVGVRGRGHSQRSGARVEQRPVVRDVRVVRPTDQPGHGQRHVVRFERERVAVHRGLHLRRRHNAHRVHRPVRVFASHVLQHAGAQPGARAAAQRVNHLEPLQAVAFLRGQPDRVHRTTRHPAGRIVTPGPVATRAAVAAHEVLPAEHCAPAARTPATD